MSYQYMEGWQLMSRSRWVEAMVFARIQHFQRLHKQEAQGPTKDMYGDWDEMKGRRDWRGWGGMSVDNKEENRSLYDDLDDWRGWAGESEDNKEEK